MKKKSFLLVFVVLCLVVSNVFAAGCTRAYRTDCPQCQARTLFKCTGHREYIYQYDDCSVIANCDIMRKEYVHVMICSNCKNYGDGAHNKIDYSYYHTMNH